MRHILQALIVLFLFASVVGCKKDDGYTHAEIETEFGTMEVILYNSTPIHRDNFIKLANEGFYDGTLFHRVMSEFMIQGGDPDSKGASPEQQLGNGGPDYKLTPEIGALHIKGALAAARQSDRVNPLKESSGSQFYVVHGKIPTDQELNQIELTKNIKYSEGQRALYKELGGTAMLDKEYTVFGEVVKGFDVIDKIADVKTGRADRPVEDVPMKVRILN